jgi:hypothetical protein
LARNAAQFGCFIIDAATRNRFVARFADPATVTDLDAWAKFEAEAPEAFPVTYQFWVNKPAEPTDSNPAQSGLGR